MIPEWMDIVIWGHEHECQITPTGSLKGTFSIVQPGSSVATSLTEGESRRKQIGLLEIKGQQFCLIPITLTNVCGFAVGNVSLGNVARDQGGNLEADDPKVEKQMTKVLSTEVKALVRYVKCNFCSLMGFQVF
jgi:double-strand break repair protein MRE11